MSISPVAYISDDCIYVIKRPVTTRATENMTTTLASVIGGHYALRVDHAGTSLKGRVCSVNASTSNEEIIYSISGSTAVETIVRPGFSTKINFVNLDHTQDGPTVDSFCVMWTVPDDINVEPPVFNWDHRVYKYSWGFDDAGSTAIYAQYHAVFKVTEPPKIQSPGFQFGVTGDISLKGRSWNIIKDKLIELKDRKFNLGSMSGVVSRLIDGDDCDVVYECREEGTIVKRNTSTGEESPMTLKQLARMVKQNGISGVTVIFDIPEGVKVDKNTLLYYIDRGVILEAMINRHPELLNKLQREHEYPIESQIEVTYPSSIV